MDIEKLCRDDFTDSYRGEPTVRFTDKGVVCFNKAAVKHLKLRHHNEFKDFYGVSICRDKDRPSEFAVVRDDKDGWKLRSDGPGGAALFNCVALARHVIDVTWEKCIAHSADCAKPRNWVFKIARLPLDDGKNSEVFALIRKKI